MGDVILVNEFDEPIGKMEKLEAHRQGLLHRAFSIFLFNKRGELLLQRRAAHKYHSGGLWTNTCCSHPEPGEDLNSAAKRRLMEELGVETGIRFDRSFIYQAGFDNGLIEHEYDHIAIGEYDGLVRPNPDEVMDYQWTTGEELKKWMSERPDDFTVWFLKIYEDRLIDNLSGL